MPPPDVRDACQLFERRRAHGAPRDELLSILAQIEALPDAGAIPVVAHWRADLVVSDPGATRDACISAVDAAAALAPDELWRLDVWLGACNARPELAQRYIDDIKAALARIPDDPDLQQAAARHRRRIDGV